MGENMNDERVQRYAETIGGGLYDSCPDCLGQGWTVEGQSWGNPAGEQVQCERCAYLNAGLTPRPGGERDAVWFIARAVMAVAEAEQAQLRAEVERLELRGSYDLSMMQCRAETAEARLARVEALVTKSDGTYVNSYTTIQAVAIIAALAGESGMVGS